MPPITTTFGAGGGRQQDMDGKIFTLLHFSLVWRLEDHTIQRLNQHSNLLPGSFLEHVSRICRYIWGYGGPVLPEGDIPSSSLLHASEGGCQDHTWGICGWRGFPFWEEEKRLIDKKANEDNKIICTSNVPTLPDGTAIHNKSICHGPLTSILCHQLLRIRMPPLLPLMTRPNWCNGTTVWVTSQLLEIARPPGNCWNSSPPSALAVYLVQWSSYLGAAKSPHVLTKSLLPPSWKRRSQSSNWNWQRWDLLPSWKGHSPRRGTGIALFLWTNTPVCVLCTSKLLTLPLRTSLPSKRLRTLLPGTVPTSNTIIVIMDDFLTMPSSNNARPAANGLLSVGWMPISRMELPSMQFRTCRRVPASSYSMLMLAGWQQCILPCNHMPSAMPPFSTTVSQCWRMGHQGLSYSAQFK